jgi:hypothetical protein
MKYLKTKALSKWSTSDRTLIAYPSGVGPGNRVVLNANGGLMLPKGGTAQRPQLTSVRQPTDANGTIRYNTDTNTLEAYIGSNWEVVKAPGATSITKQTLGPGDDILTIFGPLSQTPASDDNILVLVENVFQISVTNYSILYNYLGSGNSYIQFTSPVPLSKFITIYFGFAN